MTETPATQHPMRTAIHDGRYIGTLLACIAVFVLPALGMHGSDTLALAVAGLFLTTPNRWEPR